MYYLKTEGKKNLTDPRTLKNSRIAQPCHWWHKARCFWCEEGGKACPGRSGRFSHILVSTQEMPAALQSLSKVSPGIAEVSSRGQNHLPPKHRFSAPQPHGAVLQTWTWTPSWPRGRLKLNQKFCHSVGQQGLFVTCHLRLTSVVFY